MIPFLLFDSFTLRLLFSCSSTTNYLGFFCLFYLQFQNPFRSNEFFFSFRNCFLFFLIRRKWKSSLKIKNFCFCFYNFKIPKHERLKCCWCLRTKGAELLCVLRALLLLCVSGLFFVFDNDITTMFFLLCAWFLCM